MFFTSGFDFCFYFAISLFGSTVPTKMDLYWHMPAFTKSSVGSSSGMVDDECQ
jgi:hypothetical protein